MKYFIAIIFLFFNAYAQVPVHAQKFSLKNGMEVILLENHKVPVVSHIMWIRTGSAWNPPGESGLAHYLEHMLFKRTKNLKDGEYARTIESFGGQYNASTGNDFTNFYVTAASEYLPEIMRLESERMQHLNPEEKSFASELQVIIEERRLRVDGNPSARLSEAMTASLFRNSSYHYPGIGWKHEMEKLSRQQVMKFYRNYYCPKNAVLVLAGDITIQKARQLSEKYYGGWKNSDCRKATPILQEPPLDVDQKIKLGDPGVAHPEWSRIYLAPSLKTGEKKLAFPLMVLAQVLGAERNGVLYKEMVAKNKSAVSVAAGYDPFALGNGTFSIAVTPADGITIQEVTNQVNSILKKSVNADEVERAKKTLQAESIYARDSIEGMASIFGMLAILGEDDNFFNDWQKNIKSITVAQVNQAAKKILADQHSVTGILEKE